MATVFPALDGEDPTAGERLVYAALRRHLQPDELNWAWFEPVLKSKRTTRRPDFVLAGSETGVLVLEVKDYARKAIVGGSRARWRVLRGSDEKPVLHPEKQAREASFLLRDLLQAAPGLTHENGPHAGNIVVPVNWGVAFPNLTRADLEELEERGLLDADKCLAREDLEREDAEGARRLLAGLYRMMEVRFPAEVTPALLQRIRAAVEPQLHFLDAREEPAWLQTPSQESPAKVEVLGGDEPRPTPEAPPAVERVPLPEVPGFWLDRKQARIARELASPRTVVYGPAGSGKTVFLTSRAQYWLEQKPDARVLFTCYNASLASHLRNVFALRGLPPDGERLVVKHYHDLCGYVLGIADIHERSPEFYAALEPKVLSELSRRDDVPDFDLILVDEGQDFSRRMLEVLVRLSANGGEITVVCDPAQDIYGRWAANNLAPLRDPAVERLVDCYRNTAPIFSLALSVLPGDIREEMGLNRLELTRPEDLERHGPTPELVPLPGLDDLADLIQRVAEQCDREGVPLSDVAVLYPDRSAVPNFSARVGQSRWEAADDPAFRQPEPDPEAEGEPADLHQGTLHPNSDRDDVPLGVTPHFAQALEAELNRRGVPAEWVARNFASKAAYDISRARLTLSTVHSAKGMDFHTVIFLGAETLAEGTGAAGRRASTLMFTGITRARERLYFPYFVERGWVPLLRERLEEIVREAAR